MGKCHNCFHWTLRSLCTRVLPPSAVGDYLCSCQKSTSLIYNRGKRRDIKGDSALICTYLHFYRGCVCTSTWKQHCGISGDELLESAMRPSLVSSKPRPASKSVALRGWSSSSSSTSHQMDAAFEIHRTGLKIRLLCTTLVSLWGPRKHHITSV